MEDFTTFKIAKKLKEKGFPQDIDTYNYSNYYLFDGLRHCSTLCNHKIWWSYDNKEKLYFAPTTSQVLKWLRDKFFLHISQKPYPCEDGLMWMYEIRKFNKNVVFVIANKTGFVEAEQAAIAGIDYVLDNLI